MGRLKFNELSNKKFKEDRNIVISEAYNDEGELAGYSIAEQLVTTSNGRELKLFLKGGLGIVDYNGLLRLYDAVKEAVENAYCEDE